MGAHEERCAERVKNEFMEKIISQLGFEPKT